MKKRELMKRLRSEAARQGNELVLVREGANHEVWRFGEQRLVIPRHSEINEHTVRSILEHARKAADHGTHGD